jgi:hypothetical protein
MPKPIQHTAQHTVANGAVRVCKSIPFIQGQPPGYFTHFSITTPIARALKNYSSWNFLEVPTDILRPLPDRDDSFTSETAGRRFRK